MKKILPNDPLMAELRKKYPKRGANPKPGEDLDTWAEKYVGNVRKYCTDAEQMIRNKLPIDLICKKTGLRKETVEILYPRSSKKEAN